MLQKFEITYKSKPGREAPCRSRWPLSVGVARWTGEAMAVSLHKPGDTTSDGNRVRAGNGADVGSDKEKGE
jgi:hypothetical protein